MQEVSSGVVTRLMREPNEMVKDGLNALPMDSDLVYDEADKMSSVLPTMWLGSQSGR